MTDAPDGVTLPQLKDRPLTIGGEHYKLRFSFIASLALKERWKIEDDQAMIRRVQKQSITDIPAIVWACMQTHHPERPYEDVLRMLDDAPTADASAAYRVAMDAVGAGWGPPAKKPDKASAKSGS